MIKEMISDEADTATVPEVSILLVNWNTREMTLECLRSVYSETVKTNFELIVVDNGSSDGSVAAIEAEFPQVRLMAEAVNHGFAAATNLQAREARGDKILLLNTDTVVLDRAIDELVAFSRRYPDAKIWGGRTLFADGTLNPTSCWGKMTPWSLFCSAVGLTTLFKGSALFNPTGYGSWKRDSVRNVDIVTGCLFLIERELWEILGGFDPAFFMYAEEADLCARARKLGARPIITPSAKIVHYDGASSVSRAAKLIHLYGGAMGLIERHFSPVWKGLSRLLLLLSVFTRSAGYWVLSKLAGDARRRATAEEWRTVWRRRAEWKRGPSSKPLDG